MIVEPYESSIIEIRNIDARIKRAEAVCELSQSYMDYYRAILSVKPPSGLAPIYTPGTPNDEFKDIRVELRFFSNMCRKHQNEAEFLTGLKREYEQREGKK